MIFLKLLGKGKVQVGRECVADLRREVKVL
jgi:hypothetical protein